MDERKSERSMTTRGGKEQGQEGPPQRFGATTPPNPQADYAVHTVQTVLEMQRTLGGVETAIKHLQDRSKEYGEKLEQIGKDVHAAKIVGGVLAVVATVLGWAIHELLPLLSSLKHP
jgi:hypothetical protein